VALTITFRELHALLVSRWRTVILCIAAGIAAALLFASLGPKWYEATLAVVPVTPGRPVGLSGALAGLGSALPLDISPAGEDVERIAAIFESDSVRDGAIERLGLMDRYGDRYIEQARRSLSKRCSTTIDKKPKIIKATCEDRDPFFAQKLVLTLADLANDAFRRVGAGAATEERRFLETRVADARREADEAGAKLREFQERNGVIDLAEQSKIVVGALATLKKDELSKELELGYLSSFAAAAEPSRVQIARQLEVIRKKSRALEATAGGADAAGATGVFPGVMQIPKLSQELVRLVRDQKIREATHAMLVERLEAARVNEARDTPTFSVLDRPRVPTYRSRPTLKLLLFLGVLGGTVVAAGVLLGPALAPDLRKRLSSTTP
jgi:uncharacterized protein involved in exopolysaccharide biosynthesis